MSIVFWILAAISNSVMDTLQDHHVVSIFQNNNKFWGDTFYSWKAKYVDHNVSKGRVKLFWNINKPVWLCDGWHFMKMLMILFLCCSVYTFNGGIISIIMYPIAWGISFELFYSHLLIRGKNGK